MSFTLSEDEKTEPIWLEVDQVIEFHKQLIDAIGGSHGVRDEDLLESAVSRPQNIYAYLGADIFELAAMFAEAIAHNHPFIDGNKRTALMAADVFLEQNGFLLDEIEGLADKMVALANHDLTYEGMAVYFRQHCRPIAETDELD